MSVARQRWKLLLLGVPVLILIFTSLALTAFLAVNLIISGVREAAFANLIVGSLLAALWVLMLVKTTQARRSNG